MALSYELLFLVFAFVLQPSLGFPLDLKGSLFLLSLWPWSTSGLRDFARNATFIWIPQDQYSGKTFFDDFTFYTASDPTHGTVTYVDQTYAIDNGLAYFDEASGTVIMKGDDTTWLQEGENRSSVRISSIAQYNTGLFILDLNRAPWGCGVWPAFWTVGGGQWPLTGEIDIIEGVHDNEHNQVTWHTGPGCSLAVESNFTGTVVNGSNGQPNTDCDGSIDDNAGCGITEWSRASYGPFFEAQGGGVFAMKWDEDGIDVFSFCQPFGSVVWLGSPKQPTDRSAIPQDINDGSPNPDNWGQPVASLAPAACDPLTYFVNHSIIFDITFCGDWAGNSYATSGCPGSCSTRLMDPSNFVNASWSINSLKVYKKQAINGRVSAAFTLHVPIRWVSFSTLVIYLVFR